MSAPAATKEVEIRVASTASGLARARNIIGKGRSDAHCVRLTPTVKSLLEAAKPANQSMVQFLREAAVTVALQRLEDSQN